MNKLIVPAEFNDLSQWPTVDPNALDSPRREALLQRIDAVRRYLGKQPLARIERDTGVSRSQLYRYLRQCLQTHPDGRIRGLRALVPFARSKAYQRNKPVGPSTRISPAGAAGAMGQLLERYDDSLGAFLRTKLKQREVFIGEHDQLQGLHAVHAEFIQQCIALGLTAKHYPLNQERQGIRSLAKVLRSMATRSFAQAARLAGAEHIGQAWADDRSPDGRSITPVLRPYDLVEFDGHKMDLHLQVRYRDASGLEEHIDVNRVWLLVIIEVFSRTILGWNLVLSAEYNRHDVIRTIQHALLPQQKRASLSIAGLSYAAAGGFVSEAAPWLQGACWQRLRFDNARANLAHDSLALLCDVIGCIAEAGPVGDPTERPYVERFFGTLESHLSHRIPGTTGSHPRDIRRRLTDPLSKDFLPVSFDELSELVEITIANYNGRPHEGIGARRPIEYLVHAASGYRDTLRVLCEPFRNQIYLLQPAELRSVNGSLQHGIRPYINLYGVRYSSALLQKSTDLIGKQVRLYIDPQDLRVVHAFLTNGCELGPLKAARPWHRTQHSLRLRQEIQRLQRSRKLQLTEDQDPIALLLVYKRKQRRKERVRGAHRSAEAARSVAPFTPEQSAQAPLPSTAEPDDAPSLPRAKPRPLTLLGKGQVGKRASR